jgi:hypothetical protein
MGIVSWWKKLGKREEAARIEDAEERSLQPHEKRGDDPRSVESLAADERTARLAGEASMKDVDRLGDAE